MQNIVIIYIPLAYFIHQQNSLHARSVAMTIFSTKNIRTLLVHLYFPVKSTSWVHHPIAELYLRKHLKSDGSNIVELHERAHMISGRRGFLRFTKVY